MIEVEKKFQPTEEQLGKMLEGAEFLGEVTNHDIYYDYPDYRLYTTPENTCLRNRNGSFELKMKKGHGRNEIEDKSEIEQYFGVENLEEFVKKELIPIIDYRTKRLKYKKEGFNIDVDETDFGNGIKYIMCEIECMVEDEGDSEKTVEKILNFAKSYNFEIKKMFTKHREYLRVVKPEVYKQIFNIEQRAKSSKGSYLDKVIE